MSKKAKNSPHAPQNTPTQTPKKAAKKWVLLLLTGTALALIPRRSSLRANLSAKDAAQNSATDTDK
ncbi:hypothetical protein [Psychrobacter aestuarii]|uniref:Uncharacterized protein n=1 Tax=Psychrobacter aestuarii TaxID=556327 RepID=A0ABP3FBZ6_9GAMM|nr:hypothetical protein [Psychrobacter aestuarii]